MDKIRAVTVQFEPHEEPLAQRMGAALLLQWSSLPADVQASLRMQEIYTELGDDVDDMSMNMAEQIDRLIHTYAEHP